MEDIQVCLRGGCNGEPVRKERRIRPSAWSNVSGMIWSSFPSAKAIHCLRLRHAMLRGVTTQRFSSASDTTSSTKLPGSPSACVRIFPAPRFFRTESSSGYSIKPRIVATAKPCPGHAALRMGCGVLTTGSNRSPVHRSSCVSVPAQSSPC